MSAGMHILRMLWVLLKSMQGATVCALRRKTPSGASTLISLPRMLTHATLLCPDDNAEGDRLVQPAGDKCSHILQRRGRSIYTTWACVRSLRSCAGNVMLVVLCEQKC